MMNLAHQWSNRPERIFRRRVGRIAGGAAAALGVLAVFLAVVAGIMIGAPQGFHGSLTYAFFACWPLALAAYVGGRAAARKLLIKTPGAPAA